MLEVVAPMECAPLQNLYRHWADACDDVADGMRSFAGAVERGESDIPKSERGKRQWRGSFAPKH